MKFAKGKDFSRWVCAWWMKLPGLPLGLPVALFTELPLKVQGSFKALLRNATSGTNNSDSTYGHIATQNLEMVFAIIQLKIPGINNFAWIVTGPSQILHRYALHNFRRCLSHRLGRIVPSRVVQSVDCTVVHNILESKCTIIYLIFLLLKWMFF